MNEQRRVWLITGCSSGLGKALAEYVLESGDCVLATARQPDSIEELSRRHPDSCLTASLDVRSETEMDEAVRSAMEHWGKIDVLVNNAGYGLLGPFEKITRAQMDALFQVNFFGAVRLTQKVLTLMREQKSGHVVFISAAAAIANYPGFAFYGASKAALESVGEALALEAQSFGVKVTLVEPGPFRTNFVASSLERVGEDDPHYAGSIGKFASLLTKMDGRQPGDPAKAAEAIRAIVNSPTPPLRLILGRYATGKSVTTLTARLNEVESWKSVGLPTEF